MVYYTCKLRKGLLQMPYFLFDSAVEGYLCVQENTLEEAWECLENNGFDRVEDEIEYVNIIDEVTVDAMGLDVF